MVNLGDSNALPILIAGSVLEAVDAEGLVAQYQADIRSKAKDQKIDASQISQKLHSDLSAAGVQHYTLAVENMYQKHEQGEQNVRIWFNAENLDEAKGKIKEVMLLSSFGSSLTPHNVFTPSRLKAAAFLRSMLLGGCYRLLCPSSRSALLR